jgi:hypothetical protein
MVMLAKRKDESPLATAKKRRVLEEQNLNIPPRSSTKSSFEEDLDRLTQEIHAVESPFETDQKWSRPALKFIDSAHDALSITV